MAFAEQQHDVARARVREGGPDGLWAIGDAEVRANRGLTLMDSALDPPGYLVADRVAVLQARVFVGHHQQVTEARGDRVLDRALLTVALAGAAEHADQLALGQRALDAHQLLERS